MAEPTFQSVRPKVKAPVEAASAKLPVEAGPEGTGLRVLLLDDDPAVSRVIRNCLTRNGYSVTVAPSGVEGIRRVMEGDFEVILCEMTMPAMPGDKFYRTVERIQPALCPRIVFITGHRIDPAARDFIASVNGNVLRKPFHPTDLLDAVGFALFCNLMEGEPAQGAASLFDRKPEASPQSEPAAESEGKPPAEPLSFSDQRRKPWKTAAAIAGLAILCALGAVANHYFGDLRERAGDSTAELSAARERWAKLSGQRLDLTKAWAELQALQNIQQRLEKEQKAPRWTPALQSIATATVPGLQLRTVTVRPPWDQSSLLEIRISGICEAVNPRASVNRFRETLEAKLRDLGSKQVLAHFEHLGEDPRRAGEEEPQQVDFILTVKTAAFRETGTENIATP